MTLTWTDPAANPAPHECGILLPSGNRRCNDVAGHTTPYHSWLKFSGGAETPDEEPQDGPKTEPVPIPEDDPREAHHPAEKEDQP